MSADVLKLWAVVERGNHPVPMWRSMGSNKEDAIKDLSPDTQLAEVTFDFRNWEPVDKDHPLTQADNGCAVRVNGLEAGVIDDKRIGGLGVWVKHGECDRLYAKSSITHVARPPKPPRKTIDWGSRLGPYSAGMVNGEIVATIVVSSTPSGAVATVMHDGKMHHRVFENWNWDTAAAMNWCESVVNGDDVARSCRDAMGLCRS